MAQWINLNQKNRSVLVQQNSVLWPYPPTTSRSYISRLADKIQVELYFLNSLQVRLLYRLVSLQCYYSVKTAFQLAFVM